MEKHEIRFCERNQGIGRVYRRLTEEFSGLDIKIVTCVKQCSCCREFPTAVVDGKKVFAKSGEDLFVKVANLLI